MKVRNPDLQTRGRGGYNGVISLEDVVDDVNARDLDLQTRGRGSYNGVINLEDAGDDEDGSDATGVRH